NQVSEGIGFLTATVSGIAAISLVVGGVGIMNIMLVSVTERTREIGIRKAIGAKTSTILLQFLVEAIILSVFGGILGLLVGGVISYGILQILGLPFIMSKKIIIIAFVFSTLVGIVFGVYPAHKASKLDPIDALRYE
ncbi:MAG: FtsX-like permease family protein, partial [Clostridiales bacterium]|nr:FtsX-like permease family protein [Clostridiales bacterium]